MTGPRQDNTTLTEAEVDERMRTAAYGTDAEWFAVSGHCGRCSNFVAEAGKRYDPLAGNEYGPFRFCECEPDECGCGPHPKPEWIIPGEQALAISVPVSSRSTVPGVTK